MSSIIWDFDGHLVVESTQLQNNILASLKRKSTTENMQNKKLKNCSALYTPSEIEKFVDNVKKRSFELSKYRHSEIQDLLSYHLERELPNDGFMVRFELTDSDALETPSCTKKADLTSNAPKKSRKRKRLETEIVDEANFMTTEDTNGGYFLRNRKQVTNEEKPPKKQRSLPQEKCLERREQQRYNLRPRQKVSNQYKISPMKGFKADHSNSKNSSERESPELCTKQKNSCTKKGKIAERVVTRKEKASKSNVITQTTTKRPNKTNKKFICLNIDKTIHHNYFLRSRQSTSKG